MPARKSQFVEGIGDVALDGIPAEIAVADAFALAVAHERRAVERADDASAPRGVPGDVLGGWEHARSVAANRADKIIPRFEVAHLRSGLQGGILHAERAAGHDVRGGRMDLRGVDSDPAAVFHKIVSETPRDGDFP